VWFKRPENQSRILKWKIRSVAEWKCSDMCVLSKTPVYEVVSILTCINFLQCSRVVFSIFLNSNFNYICLYSKATLAHFFKNFHIFFKKLYNATKALAFASYFCKMKVKNLTGLLYDKLIQPVYCMNVFFFCKSYL
jgi:hypothetical protein